MESGGSLMVVCLLGFCALLPYGTLAQGTMSSNDSTDNANMSTPSSMDAMTTLENISSSVTATATPSMTVPTTSSIFTMLVPSATEMPGSGSGASGIGPDIETTTTTAANTTPSLLPNTSTSTSTPTTSITTTSISTAPTSAPTTLSVTTPPPTSESPSEPPSEPPTDTTSTSTSSSPPPSGSNAIVGVAVACVLLVIVVLLFGVAMCVTYCCHIQYCSNMGYTRKKSYNLELEDIGNGKLTNTEQLFAHLDDEDLVTVSLDGLLQHVEILAEDDGYKAEEEYNAARENDPTANTHHASLTCNEGKNRYINILARDDTRVILKSGKGSDYINGNYIEGFHCEREYVACQGPLPDTVTDFWKMMWEQRSTVIVMVTNPTENGMVKCESYWPALASMQYGSYVVKLESELMYPEFIIRQFTLIFLSNKNRKEEGRRNVTQFHFTSWPDFGVPQDPSSMLKFVRCIRGHMSRTEITGPVVVHCSAGVGRTGTFIAIDTLTQKIAEAKRTESLSELRISVQEVVCQMRAQRGNMVQTSAQYLFIYNSLMRLFTHGRTDVKQQNLKEHIAKLAMPVSGESSMTWLEKEFSHVMNVKLPTDSLSTVACEDYNEFKNRDMDNIPFDHNRVLLEGKESDEEDYINASYIDGYYNRVEFICTEHPLPHTRTQFWTMLVERSIDVFVVFGPIKDPEDRYWPEEKEVLRLSEDLTIVGEEVDVEDEEDEERGREGDTEEEVEEKERREKKEEKRDNQASGSLQGDEGPEDKVSEKSSREENVVEKQASIVQKEVEGASGIEQPQKEEGKDVELRMAEGDKMAEEMKKEEHEKVEDKKAEEERKEEEDRKGEEEKKEEEDKKAEEGKKDEERKKPEEDIFTEIAKILEKPIFEGQAAAEEAGGQEKKDETTMSEEKKTPELKNPDIEEKVGDKKEDSLEVVASKDEAVGGITLDTGAMDMKLGVEATSGTGESTGKTRKKSTGEKETLVVRNFTVTMDETAQSVKMYHIVGWPTEGVPESVSPMVQLVQKSREHWKNTGFNCILLHTATGVKEEVSGIYCGLCILMRMLQIEQEADMVTTLERLRLQRPGILRNKELYMYMYKVLEKSVEQ